MNFRKKQILRRRLIFKPESSFSFCLTEGGSFVLVVEPKPRRPKINLKGTFTFPNRNFIFGKPLSLQLPPTVIISSD